MDANFWKLIHTLAQNPEAASGKHHELSEYHDALGRAFRRENARRKRLGIKTNAAVKAAERSCRTAARCALSALEMSAMIDPAGLDPELHKQWVNNIETSIACIIGERELIDAGGRLTRAHYDRVTGLKS
jgi:hypothetical protein